MPGHDRATIYNGGRDSSRYPWKAILKSETDLEKLLAEVNNAPPYAEFYPFRRDRCIYVNQASARTSQAEIAFPQGQLGYLYQADLQIESSEARCYGPEQGIGYQQNVAVPDWLYSPLLKNNGSFANGLDYLMLSGGYKGGYAQNSGLIVLNVVSNKKILNGHIPLCKKHIVGDIFVLDRFGNCEHSYSSNFSIPYSFLQGSLLGKDHCDRGSISDGVLTIGPEGRLFFPFIDLLPAKYGYLDVAVISISGSPSVAYVNSKGVARSLALLHWGQQRVYLPSDIQGQNDVVFGISCGKNDNVSLKSVKALVGRYVAPSAMPQVPPGGQFYMVISCGGGKFFNALHVTYRDSYPI